MSTALRSHTTGDILCVLSAVTDPVLDKPITTLGLVESVMFEGDAVEVHLRIPSPVFTSDAACLIVADSFDALRGIDGIGRVGIRLVDHPDSVTVDAVTAFLTGSRDTREPPAGHDTDDLRELFLRKVHKAAVERSLASHLTTTGAGSSSVGSLTLRDLRGEKYTTELLRRRSALGLSLCPNSRVLVDEKAFSLQQNNFH